MDIEKLNEVITRKVTGEKTLDTKQKKLGF